MDSFFDLPWWVPAGLAVAGIALFLWANARTRKREQAFGLGLIALAVLLAVVSYLVDTPRETVEKRTRMFVAAVVAKDKPGIGDLLASDASAFAWNKQDIIEGAVYYADETGLSGARLISLEAVKDGDVFVSYITVWSQHSGASSFPMADLTSQWKLEWARDKEKWVIVAIVPLQIGPIAREDIERRYLDSPVPTRGRR